jgi:hypothetical protein
MNNGRIVMRSSNSLLRGAVACALVSVLSSGASIEAATAATKPAAPQPEPAGIRICLAPAKAEVPGGVDAVAAVRESFAGFLTGPSLAVEPLSARLESQVREEAKLKNCRYLLFSTVKHTRKTSGLFERAAASAVQNGAAEVAAYSRTSGGRIAASAASAGAANMAVATQVHQRDQLTLEYRLEDAEGRVISAQTQQRKAKSDGEDVLTPLVQNAAESIVEALERLKI